MALLSQKQFIDIWTQLDALLGAVAAAPQNATGVAAQWGDYGDTTAYTGTRNLTALTEAGGVFTQLASAAPGAPVGTMAAIANLGFIELANAYVDYLNDGGAAVTGIAKPRGAGDPGQSYHDNILGNLGEVSASDRLRDYTGPELNLGGYIYNPAANYNADPMVADKLARSEAAIEFGANRPNFSGELGDMADRYNTLGWDLTHGIDAQDLDISPLQGKYLIVNGATSTVYNDLASLRAAVTDGAQVVMSSGDVTTAQLSGNSSGDDFFFGQAGRQTIDGNAEGAGGDTFSFGPVAQTGAFADLEDGMAFSGETGLDTLVDIENLVGTAGDDVFLGSSEANVFYATTGADELDGRGGNDTFDSSSFAGNTVVDLDAGTASGAVTATLASVENATTGSGNDTLVGNDEANVLFGNAGSDTFTGNGGDDTIDGGIGLDTAVFGARANYEITWDGSTALVTEIASGDVTTITDVEKLSFSDTTAYLVSTSSTSYKTIGSALTAASNGDQIYVGPGSYAFPGGDLVKAVSFFGANAGLSGNDANDAANAARGSETVITGAQIRIAALDLVSFDGFKFVNSRFDSYTNDIDVALVNNVIEGVVTNQRLFYVGRADSVTLENNRVTNMVPNSSGSDAFFIAGDYDGTSGTVATISGNVFLGAANASAFQLSNVKATVSGNTFDLGGFSVFAANQSDVLVSGNTITNSVSANGAIRTWTPGSEFKLVITGNEITGNAVGVNVQEGNTIPDGAILIDGNIFASNGKHIVNRGTVGSDIAPAGDNSFDGIELADMTDDELLALSDKIVDAVDAGTFGSVVLKAGHVYLTVNSFYAPNTTAASLQRALNTAVDSDVVHVGAGAYTDGAAIANAEGLTITAPAGATGLSVTLGVDVAGITLEGEADINVTGNADANTIVGNAGNNVIDGAAGADTMEGGAGNDTYLVDNAGDVVVEADDEGADSVVASSDYVLGTGVSVESLSAADGTDSIDLTGNELAQTITGNDGDNRLQGAAGTDILDGGLGIDTAVYADASEISAVGGQWQVVSSEGTETLSNIEVVEVTGGDRTLLVGAGGFANLEDALEAAVDGDTILLAAGETFTHSGVLTISKSVTILGANADVGFGPLDVRGPESVINGQLLINAAGPVVIDGVKFVHDEPVAGRAGPSNRLLVEVVTTGHTISNNLFESSVAGAANSGNGLNDVAVIIRPLAGGTVTVSDNRFAGDPSMTFGAFGTAAWGRAIWSDGGGVATVITGNEIENARSAVNLDTFNNALSNVSGNQITNSGTGFAFGLVSGPITAVSGNVFTDVGTEINAQNLSGGISFDAGATGNSAMTGATPAQFEILGGTGADTITGTSGADRISGGSGTAADILSGGDGDDLFIYTNADQFGLGESIDGGAGTADTISFAPSAAGTLTLTDAVDNIEVVTIGGATASSVNAAAVENALTFNGNAANNTFTGTAFSDTFNGGGGTDTVVESGAVEYDADTGTWSLGGQVLSDIEIVEGAGGVRTLLVGDGGFDTIEEALAAANSGDTVMLSADTYTISSALSLTKDVTIIGANSGVAGADGRGGETVLMGPAAGPIFGIGGGGLTITIDGVKIVGDHILNSGNVGDDFTLTNSVLELTTNAANNIYYGYNGGYEFTFTNNYVETDGYTDAVLMLFEGGVLNVSNNTFVGVTPTGVATSGINGVAMNINGSATTGASGLVTGNTFTNMDIGVMLAGHIGDLDVTDNTFQSPDGYGTGILFFEPNYTGEINIDDNTFDGVFAGIRGSSYNGGTIEGMDVSADGNIFIDNVHDVRLLGGGVLHLTDSTIDSEVVPSLFVGGSSNDTIVGSAIDDIILGGGGSDTITGNGGTDVLDGGDGDDTFNFGSTADALNATVSGGSGTDTVAFNTSGGETSVDLATVASVVSASVERVTIGGAAVNLTALGLTTGLTLVGNAAANTITGTSGNDVIQGLAGDDVVKYKLAQGNDRFEGGANLDTFEVDGTGTSSTIYSLTSAGTELRLATGASTQELAGVEKIKISLSSVGDKVTLSGDLVGGGIAGAGSEVRILAGAGKDVIDASGIVGAARLVIDLGAEDDIFVGGRSDQTVTGGDGLRDRYDFSNLSGSVTFNMGTGVLLGPGAGGVSTGNTGFEQVRGTAFNDILNGNSNVGVDETFYASLGSDSINGRGNAVDGAGDTYSGVYTNPDGSKSSIEAIYVSLEDGFATDMATSAAFLQTLVNIENITGSIYDDVLIGDAGNNIIDGEAGVDQMFGGDGNDTYIANSAGDVINEYNGTAGGIDTMITSRGQTSLFSGVENLTITGIATSAYGNELDNHIIGNGANNTIRGLDGNDRLQGGAGFDALTGGVGSDTFIFNVGDTGVGSGNRDRILDFVHAEDKIDISGMSAFDFAYRGTGAFTTGGVDAPQVRWLVAGSQTVIQGDYDGNGSVDFEIQLTGNNLGLTQSDFLL